MKKIKASSRVSELEYAIRDVALLADKIEKETGEKVIRLNIGDPTYYDFDVPDSIKKAMKEAVEEGYNYYSSSLGVMELRESIVKLEKELRGVSIQVDDVVVTNGLSEAIMAIIGASLNPGEKILVPSPTYPPYISATKFYNAIPVEYKTVEEEGWLPDIDDIRNRVDEKTKAIVVINPNNPTGAVYTSSLLKEIVDIAGEHGLFVISDEIYDRLVFEGSRAPSLAEVNSDVPTLILNGFSKVYLATGWRVGYIYRLDEEGLLDDIWNGIIKYLLIRISGVTPAQVALARTILSSKNYLKKYLSELRKRRDYAYKRIQEIDGLTAVKPKGALYIFPRIETKRYVDDKEFVIKLLEQEKVLVVNGSGFGREGQGHFRAVFLPPIKIQEEAYDRIERFLR